MAINLSFMHAFSAHPGSALRALPPTLGRGLAWLAVTPLVAVLCLTAAPEARAISFDNGSAESNPFYSTNWTTSEDPAVDPLVAEEVAADFAGQNLFFATPAGFEGSSIFSLSSGLTTRPYDILFVYTYTPDDPESPSSATYQICNTSGCDVAVGFGQDPDTLLPTPIPLDSGEFLRSSTPPPSPPLCPSPA